MFPGPAKSSRPIRLQRTIDRANARLEKRLANKNISLSSVDGRKMEFDMTERIRAFEEDSNSKNPDVEMGDPVKDRYIMERLESSRWNINKPKDGRVSEAFVITITRKITVPAMKQTANVNLKKADEVASTTANQNTIPRASENNQTPCSHSCSKNTATCPPELQAILEAEEHRAAQTATNLKMCTAAINSVENALESLSRGPSVQFIDPMKVYLRAAIAQFLLSGPGTVLPNLLPSPNYQNHGGKIMEKTIQKQPELLQKENQARLTSVKPTWATVAQTGHHTPAAPVKDARAHNKASAPTRSPATASKTAPQG